MCIGAPHASSEPPGFSVGDYVRVVVDEETLKTMQEGHGGWDALMTGASWSCIYITTVLPVHWVQLWTDHPIQCGRKLGLVWSILESGDLKVKYGKITWPMNPKAFIKVSIVLPSTWVCVEVGIACFTDFCYSACRWTSHHMPLVMWFASQRTLLKPLYCRRTMVAWMMRWQRYIYI